MGGLGQIATVVPSPSVEASSREIYMKTTPRLIVNGTNFNLKNTELYFDPPLQEGTVIQKQVRSGGPWLIAATTTLFYFVCFVVKYQRSVRFGSVKRRDYGVEERGFCVLMSWLEGLRLVAL